jgi:putative IMPACT (imprinted ancient) family translation regulator
MGRTIRNKDKQTKKFLKQCRKIRKKRGMDNSNDCPQTDFKFNINRNKNKYDDDIESERKYP